MIDIIGLVWAMLTTISVGPQIYQNYRKKDKGWFLGSLILAMVGTACGIIYNVAEGAPPITIGRIIFMEFLFCVMFVQYFMYRDGE